MSVTKAMIAMLLIADTQCSEKYFIQHKISADGSKKQQILQPVTHTSNPLYEESVQDYHLQLTLQLSVKLIASSSPHSLSIFSLYAQSI